MMMMMIGRGVLTKCVSTTITQFYSIKAQIIQYTMSWNKLRIDSVRSVWFVGICVDAEWSLIHWEIQPWPHHRQNNNIAFQMKICNNTQMDFINYTCMVILFLESVSARRQMPKQRQLRSKNFNKFVAVTP